MKVQMTFTEAELAMLLIAMNMEQHRQIENGPPQQRKLATELRDRLVEKVLECADVAA